MELHRIQGPKEGLSIPGGLSTSPGVYFDDKLWLIGGSQIDPDSISNEVWYFDTKTGIWENRGDAEWSKRMGHAVLVFQNNIWVMGGRDEAGNPLNDVWTLDVNARQWKEQAKKAAWGPRCLFHPTVFNNQIWLFGGAEEPFSEKLYDDLYYYANANDQWQKKEITLTKEVKRPIGSCLQVFKEKLHLFGNFRTVDPDNGTEKVKPLAFLLSTPSTNTWTDFPSDSLKNWGADTTFSYQLVNFKDKMLIAKALAYGGVEPILKVYVAFN